MLRSQRVSGQGWNPFCIWGARRVRLLYQDDYYYYYYLLILRAPRHLDAFNQKGTLSEEHIWGECGGSVSCQRTLGHISWAIESPPPPHNPNVTIIILTDKKNTEIYQISPLWLKIQRHQFLPISLNLINVSVFEYKKKKKKRLHWFKLQINYCTTFWYRQYHKQLTFSS